jgi:hypothetical protein
MSVLTKTVVAAGLVLALGTAAQAAGEPWVLNGNQAYVVDMQGHTMIATLPEMTKRMMAKAKAVPRGTVFFMHDGKLMMMFDRNTVIGY